MSVREPREGSAFAWIRLFQAAKALVPSAEVDERWRKGRFLHREPKEWVLGPGDPNAVVFVARGFVRFYTCAEEGREFNQFFGVPGDFVHAFLAERQHTPYGAEALESSEVLIIPTNEWESSGPTASGELVLAVKDRMLEHKAWHSKLLQLHSTRARIDSLRAWKPDWWLRAPHYHLANYLGVSEVTLSRAIHRDRS